MEPTPLYERFLRHPHVATDSRRIAPGALFFALRGERFDGNRFALQALDAGAACAVVDDPQVVRAAGTRATRIITVPDVLKALQQLAAEHRRALGIPVLAISGSNGKTTTKELTARVLGRRFRVRATEGNLNNAIGVPLTLLGMDEQVEFAVVEMGASACGELKLLASIAQPDYALLTNVGRAHLEGFGGPEGVRRGKGELYDYLAVHGGCAFVRTDDATLAGMVAERPELRTVSYTLAAADGQTHHLEGDYNRANVAAAVAVGRHFGVSEEQIAAAIEGYRPDNHRSECRLTGRNRVVVDCYNANPSSMRAALDHFFSPQEGAPGLRRALILGDMLELGVWSDAEHREVVGGLIRRAPEHVLLIGEAFTAAAAASGPAARRFLCFPDREACAAYLAGHPIEGCSVLVKGSHGIGLEELIGLL